MTTLTGHKTYEVRVYDEDLGDDPKPFMQWYQDILDQIPESDRASATIDSRAGEYYSYTHVQYQHRETDDELLARLQREEAERVDREAKRVRADEIRRATEIATLKSLQAKYPGVSS